MTVKGRTDGLTPTEIPDDFRDWLRRQRSLRDLSQAEVAKMAGIDYATYASLERPGSKRLYMDVLVRVAGVYDIELGYFLFKAGFNISRDGIDMQRVRRVEAVGNGFRDIHHLLRRAMTEAVATLDVRSDAALAVLPAEGSQTTLDRLHSAIVTLDLVAERLDEAGFLTGAPAALAGSRTATPWSNSDLEFLRKHAEMTTEEVARAIGRTSEAVRSQRRALTTNNDERGAS